jgi:hypothetical protein
MGPEEKTDLKARAVSALKIPEETLAEDIELDEPELSDESITTAVALPQKASMSEPPPSYDVTQTVEELIGRIESRLQDHIRVVVESRLPELVRSIVSEEIERLRKEFQQD